MDWIRKTDQFLNKRIKFILFLSSTIFLWQAYEDDLFSLFNKYVLPVLNIKTNIITHIAVLILSLCFIQILYRCYKHKYITSLKSIIYLFIIASSYIRYRCIYNGSYTVIPDFYGFGYLDLICFYLITYNLLILFNYHKLCKKGIDTDRITQESILIKAENPISEIDDDLLQFNKEAEYFANYILKNIDRKSSFSIGIVSEWGTGKTSYINLIKKNLDQEEFISISFNPRLSKDISSIQKDLFEALRQHLSKYNSVFSSLFTNYIHSLNIDDGWGVIKTIKSFAKEINKENEKERINDAINSIRKRIVIFIDDFDRLIDHEIIEVFKLIYYNGSFTNIIFISAYDKTHINKTLGEYNKNQKTHFTDKFFDMEILLPLRTHDDLYDILIKLLDHEITIKNEDIKEAIPLEETNNNKDNNKDNGFNSLLSEMKDEIKHCLPTLRDIKRFCSLFIESYNRVEGEVNIEDFLLLTLLKYKCPEVYDDIHKKIIIEEKDNRYSLNEEQTIRELSDMEKKITNKLFTEGKTIIHYREITNKEYFNSYFRQDNIKYLSMKDLDELLTIEENILCKRLDNWKEKEAFADIIEYILFRYNNNFNNIDEYKRLIFLTLYSYQISNNENLYKKIKDLISNTYKYWKNDELELPDLKAYMKNILENNDNQYQLLLEKLLEDMNKITNPIFSIQELNEIHDSNITKHKAKKIDSSEFNSQLSSSNNSNKDNIIKRCTILEEQLKMSNLCIKKFESMKSKVSNLFNKLK